MLEKLYLESDYTTGSPISIDRESYNYPIGTRVDVRLANSVPQQRTSTEQTSTGRKTAE